DEEHLDGPGSDAADGGEPLENFGFGQPSDFSRVRDHAIDSFGSDVFDGGDFGAGQAGAAQFFVGGGQNVFRVGKLLAGVQSLEAAKNGFGGGAAQLLVGHRAHERGKGSGTPLATTRAGADASDDT